MNGSGISDILPLKFRYEYFPTDTATAALLINFSSEIFTTCGCFIIYYLTVHTVLISTKKLRSFQKERWFQNPTWTSYSYCVTGKLSNIVVYHLIWQLARRKKKTGITGVRSTARSNATTIGVVLVQIKYIFICTTQVLFKEHLISGQLQKLKRRV